MVMGYAKRRVLLRDGAIESDTLASQSEATETAAT